MQNQTNSRTFLRFIVGSMFLSSVTLCNTSYFTRSVQLIFSSTTFQITYLPTKCNISCEPLYKFSRREFVQVSDNSDYGSALRRLDLIVDLEETDWKVRSVFIWLIRGTSGELVRSKLCILHKSVRFLTTPTINQFQRSNLLLHLINYVLYQIRGTKIATARDINVAAHL